MNIVQLHRNDGMSIEDFTKTLNLTSLTLEGKKNRVNTWREIVRSGYALPVMAMDEMTDIEGQTYFASTFEGAAALSTVLTVHDNPDLSAFGSAFFDGHMLWVSLPELTKQSLSEVDMVQWLRDGCGACAAHALGIERETSWTYVDPKDLTPILRGLDVNETFWNPNPAQDAYRYSSALEKLCSPLQESIPVVQPCVLDSGVVNQEWATVLSAWDTFHASKEWNTRRTNKSGALEVGRLLGNVLNTVEADNMQEHFVRLVVRAFSPDMTEDEKIRAAKVAAKAVETKQQVMSIVNALSTSNMDERLAKKIASEDVHRTLLKYIWYGRYLDSNDQRDLMVSVAISIKDASGEMERKLSDYLATASGVYTSEQLNILTQYQTFVLRKIDGETNDGSVVKNLLSDSLCVKRPSNKPLQLSPLEHVQTLVRWVDKHGLGFNSDFNNKQISDSWNYLMYCMDESEDQRVREMFPALVKAGQKHDINFPSNLCAVLMEANVFNNPMVDCLFENGANWNYKLHEKTLAQLVSEEACANFTLKTQARRALQENGLPENVIPFARKQ